MAEVVVFHHAQGLTPGVTTFADELRHAGHTVHTPDLFDGRTFSTIEDGMAYAEKIGFPGEIFKRGAQAVEALTAELVYAGFSLGVLPAQMLAQTRSGARGALLFYSCVPVGEFGSGWPDGVPVQVHGMDADPIFVGEGDLDAAERSSSRPSTPSCSFTGETSTTSPTARCRPTTPKRPRSSCDARWSSWTASARQRAETARPAETQAWNDAISCSEGRRRRPSSKTPDAMPRWTEATSSASSAPTWSSRVRKSATQSSLASGAKK